MLKSQFYFRGRTFVFHNDLYLLCQAANKVKQVPKEGFKKKLNYLILSTSVPKSRGISWDDCPV
jgi:hypothetical protein